MGATCRYTLQRNFSISFVTFFFSIVYTYTLHGIFLDIALIFGGIWKDSLELWNTTVRFFLLDTLYMLDPQCFAKCVSNASANCIYFLSLLLLFKEPSLWIQKSMPVSLPTFSRLLEFLHLLWLLPPPQLLMTRGLELSSLTWLMGSGEME